MDMHELFSRLGGIRPVRGRVFDPMPELEILSIENYLGCDLPEAYRTFLALFGATTLVGTSPDNPFVEFFSLTPLPVHISSNGNGLFDAFYGRPVDEQDAYGLSVRMRFYVGRMPNSIIPIGDDGGAGQICLAIKGREVGRIFYWDQKNEPLSEEDYLEDFGEPRPASAIFQNIYLVAMSFEDFLQHLEPGKPV